MSKKHFLILFRPSLSCTCCQVLWHRTRTTPGGIHPQKAKQSFGRGSGCVVERSVAWNRRRPVHYGHSCILARQWGLASHLGDFPNHEVMSWTSQLWFSFPPLVLVTASQLSQPLVNMGPLPSAEATGAAQMLQPPVLALWLHKPSDGLPLLQEWLVTATDIVHGGFEGWRETIEVRCLDSSCLGKQMEYGCFTPTKGVGRSSIILFAILYTFHNLKEKLSNEEIEDFARLWMGWHAYMHLTGSNLNHQDHRRHHHHLLLLLPCQTFTVNSFVPQL